MTNENARRILRARAAINAYATVGRTQSEPDGTNVTDLLADLMHAYAADPDAFTEYGRDVVTDPYEWLCDRLASASNHFHAESE